MNNQNNLVATNLRHLRNTRKWSQEYVAEKVGVSRQAVAKWENGAALPDLLNCATLADLYEVDLNELVRYDADSNGLPIGPVNKHIFGTVTVGERGQVVLPKKARDTFNITPGDTLIVLGDTSPTNAGIAIIPEEVFLKMTGQNLDAFFPKDEV